MIDIEERQRIEVMFWKSSKEQNPEANSLRNVVNKVSDAGVFLDCIDRHFGHLPSKGRILELGGGQGWASCVYKKIFPESHVTSTDISKYAVLSLHKWERFFEVKIDKSYACKSYETEEQDNTLDLIFCFAAAHHFLAHKRTLLEITRILKPGGKAIYFYEPITPRFFYSLAYWRANKKSPEVPEDVLITSKIRRIASDCGLDLHVDYYPSLIKRGAIETLYFFILGHFQFLQRLLPCTANFVFTKKGHSDDA